MKLIHKIGFASGALLIVFLVVLIVLRAFFLSFVDNYEMGFVYNKVSGKITRLERTGYFLFAPWFYSVHAIDLRPIQLQITANASGSTMNSNMNDVNQRVLNAKLVRFNPNGLETFVEWHGRNAGDNRRSLAEILRCYAFDRAEGRDCPFLTIESELATPVMGNER